MAIWQWIINMFEKRWQIARNNGLMIIIALLLLYDHKIYTNNEILPVTQFIHLPSFLVWKAIWENCPHSMCFEPDICLQEIKPNDNAFITMDQT